MLSTCLCSSRRSMLLRRKLYRVVKSLRFSNGIVENLPLVIACVRLECLHDDEVADSLHRFLSAPVTDSRAEQRCPSRSLPSRHATGKAWSVARRLLTHPAWPRAPAAVPEAVARKLAAMA